MPQRPSSQMMYDHITSYPITITFKFHIIPALIRFPPPLPYPKESQQSAPQYIPPNWHQEVGPTHPNVDDMVEASTPVEGRAGGC